MISINFVIDKIAFEMTNFDKQKLTEILLYILNKTKVRLLPCVQGNIFANISYLAKYGFPIVSDEFCALPDGPVPSVLYNCIKGDPQCDKSCKQ